MNLYNHIIKLFIDKELYTKYNKYLDTNHIKENYPETFKIYKTLENIHASTKEEAPPLSMDDLQLAFYASYPASKKEVYDSLFDNIRNEVVRPDSIVRYLESVRNRVIATDIARSALRFAEGADDALQEIVSGVRAISQGEVGEGILESKDKDFISDDLEELYSDKVLTKGLRWRLESLNKSLGSLRKGDFGFIFARPETGKTTFLASECTHMATQTDRPIIWFNNEEQSGKVMIRCIQATLGLKLEQLYSNVKENNKKYQDMMEGRLKIYDGPAMTMKEVEAVCLKHNPSMIIFDQIDKIKGTTAERYDLQMKAIYQWARELSKKYGPVIGVCQAGGTGDGKKWLTMNDVDSSHTAKQGEADFMLGIGKTYDNGLEEVRYFHLCKNKLEGDLDTDPDLRHGKWEVRIEPAVARYSDF